MNNTWKCALVIGRKVYVAWKRKMLHDVIVGHQAYIHEKIDLFIPCVAGVRKGRGRELRRETARGRREEGNSCKEAIVLAIPLLIKKITKIS